MDENTENNLREAVKAAVINRHRSTKSIADAIRREVESVLAEFPELNSTSAAPIIEKFDHCFLDGSEGPIKKAYIQGYIGNIVDAARGK